MKSVFVLNMPIDRVEQLPTPADSLLRLAKMATVDHELIDKTIGRLSRNDLEAAKEAFCRVFATWVR